MALLEKQQNDEQRAQEAGISLSRLRDPSMDNKMFNSSFIRSVDGMTKAQVAGSFANTHTASMLQEHLQNSTILKSKAALDESNISITTRLK